MKRLPNAIVVLAAVLGLAVAGLACSLGPSLQPPADWTPAAALTSAPQTPGGAILPTPVGRPEATAQPAVTFTSTQRPTATLPAASATPTTEPTQPSAPAAAVTRPGSPTPDPKLFIVTEEDIATAVAAGAGQQEGLNVEGLVVRFSGGKVLLNAEELSYGLIRMTDLAIVGRLVAVNGVLQFETESISPRSLITALIPTMINQAFQRSTAQWYIEDVRALDGRLEIRIK